MANAKKRPEARITAYMTLFVSNLLVNLSATKPIKIAERKKRQKCMTKTPFVYSAFAMVKNVATQTMATTIRAMSALFCALKFFI